ncbi:hypothetical protein B0J12DRAFT_782814 [Macrophomina phaseolina]|uniref:Uncharacterized protein n=1 Tax=Macrophomina phaseolina TaxID=35725 RepID=A0ABQ8GMA8_9PEZI|nr:hypothetical protein B0J12DRAFT_782814 [Macrophomina phaseolina]
MVGVVGVVPSFCPAPPPTSPGGNVQQQPLNTPSNLNHNGIPSTHPRNNNPWSLVYPPSPESPCTRPNSIDHTCNDNDNDNTPHANTADRTAARPYPRVDSDTGAMRAQQSRSELGRAEGDETTRDHGVAASSLLPSDSDKRWDLLGSAPPAEHHQHHHYGGTENEKNSSNYYYSSSSSSQSTPLLARSSSSSSSGGGPIAHHFPHSSPSCYSAASTTSLVNAFGEGGYIVGRRESESAVRLKERGKMLDRVVTVGAKICDFCARMAGMVVMRREGEKKEKKGKKEGKGAVIVDGVRTGNGDGEEKEGGCGEWDGQTEYEWVLEEARAYERRAMMDCCMNY